MFLVGFHCWFRVFWVWTVLNFGRLQTGKKNRRHIMFSFEMWQDDTRWSRCDQMRQDATRSDQIWQDATGRDKMWQDATRRMPTRVKYVKRKIHCYRVQCVATCGASLRKHAVYYLLLLLSESRPNQLGKYVQTGFGCMFITLATGHVESRFQCVHSIKRIQAALLHTFAFFRWLVQQVCYRVAY